MPAFLAFLLRGFAVAAGLVFALSLAVALAVLAFVWLLRSVWARLAGRPVLPFAMRFGARSTGFAHAMRRAAAATSASAASRTPRADAVLRGRGLADVTDVEPK